MSKKNCILKRRWQSKTGLQEDLYLGYDTNNKLGYTTDLSKAKIMTEEECKELLLVLANSKQIVIDVLPKDFAKNEVIEESTDGQSN